MSEKTIYFGRFISTPKPDQLLIRNGAVLVSSTDGRGVIEKVDWEVKTTQGAAKSFGVDAPVVTSKDNGFFFPGFIGKLDCFGFMGSRACEIRDSLVIFKLGQK